jgi:hypothetical protein
MEHDMGEFIDVEEEELFLLREDLIKILPFLKIVCVSWPFSISLGILTSSLCPSVESIETTSSELLSPSIVLISESISSLLSNKGDAGSNCSSISMGFDMTNVE